MPMIQPKAARLLLIAGLWTASLCGCHSDGSFPALRPGLGQPEQRSTNPQGVGAVQLDGRQKLEIQLALARTLEQRGELERAEAVYRKILDRTPDQPQSLHRLAIVRDRQRRFEESEQLFRKALKAQPGSAAVFGDFGYSLYLQRRWSEAERNLRQAIALDPQDRRAHNHLGLVLAQTDRRDEALDEFARAGCTVAQSHANVALVAEMNGRLAESAAEYHAAALADPDNPVFQRHLQRMEQVRPSQARRSQARPSQARPSVVAQLNPADVDAAASRPADQEPPRPVGCRPLGSVPTDRSGSTEAAISMQQPHQPARDQ